MTGHRIIELPELLEQIARHRARGKTIVLTNGCFDLFHLGHLETLEAARRQGDVLVVALNSDASVRRLKGPGRPIVPERERARIVAALACVDYVTIFDAGTPHRLLEFLRPDVLVKGGTTGQIAGREIVEAYGGRVLRTEAVAGLSTSIRLQKLSSTPRCRSPIVPWPYPISRAGSWS